MFWIIRGTESGNDQDFEMVVEAASQAAAEMWALKRNVPYIIIAVATDEDITVARQNKRLWKYTPESRYKCLGQPVLGKQLACLLLCGVWTITLLLTRTTNLPQVLSRTMMTRNDIRPVRSTMPALPRISSQELPVIEAA